MADKKQTPKKRDKKLDTFLVAVYQGSTNEKWVVAYILGAIAFALAFYLAKRGVK